MSHRNITPIDDILLVMAQSHERLLRRKTRQFGNFPTNTYSNRIPIDWDVPTNTKRTFSF